MNTAQYVTNNAGKTIAVQLPIKKYEQLIAKVEELEAIKEYRKAKQHSGNAIPFAQAFIEIEAAITVLQQHNN